MSGDRSLNRDELVQLLTELGAELDSGGVRGELFIVGGAAIEAKTQFFIEQLFPER